MITESPFLVEFLPDLLGVAVSISLLFSAYILLDSEKPPKLVPVSTPNEKYKPSAFGLPARVERQYHYDFGPSTLVTQVFEARSAFSPRPPVLSKKVSKLQDADGGEELLINMLHEAHFRVESRP